MNRFLLRQIEPKVEHILETRSETRDNDFQLYLVVLQEYGFPTDKPLRYFLSHRGEYPSYEGITRVRRRVQARRPELRGSAPALVTHNEEEYRAYALDIN